MHGYGKRLLSFLLAMVMVFSLLPVNVLAEEETHDHDHEHTEETQAATEPQVTEPEATEAATQPQAQTEPEETEPEVTEPEETEPEVTEPEETEPEETEPEETEPEETEPEETEPEETEPEGTEPENPAIAEFQDQIDEMLDWYLGYFGMEIPKGPLTDEEREELDAQVEDIVANKLTVDDIWMAQVELYDLEQAMLEALTEDEGKALVEYNPALIAFYQSVEAHSAGPNTLDDHTPVTGILVSVSGATSDNLANGAVTVTATGSAGFLGFGASAKTATITVKNDSAESATVSFDWTATSVNQLVIDGVTYSTASGSFSKVLAAGSSVTATVTTAKNSTTNTLVMSNFAIQAIQAESKVIFDFDSTLGSVSVAEQAIEPGSEHSISSTGQSVVAAPVSGARFLGWVDNSSNAILSTDATYTLTPAGDMNVTAVFAKDNSEKMWWLVGSTTKYDYTRTMLVVFTVTDFDYYTVTGTHLFDDLSSAAEFARTSDTSKYVVLMNNGVLPAGDHTIPAGVTLLIPYDSNNTLYTTGAVSTGTYSKPTAYRTLTLASGANLIINGAVSLSAQHKYANAGEVYGAAPTGPVSFIQMQGNSNITVNNGGTLYAYGYVTGSGSVTVNSGGTVYETFQIADFRGGTQSTGMDNGVFPLSQYYVQNIEVPMTLYSGAMEHSFTTIYMSSTEVGSSVKFIAASGAMFNLTSGYVVKKYDGSRDRLVVEAHGALTLSSISMQVGTSSINSAEYELPINGNISVEVCPDSTITIGQDVAMLPGSEIIIRSGATCKLGPGINVYLYDKDEWGTFCSSINRSFIPVAYAPSKTYTRTEADLVDAKIQVDGTVDASSGKVYTTAGGANIFSTGGGRVTLVTGTETATYQLVQGTGYTTIPITPAKLKNADGTFTSTANEGTDAHTYVYNTATGIWHKEGCDAVVTETVNTQATCTTAGSKTVACSCGAVSGTVEIPATGHTPGAAATCTDDQTCTVCGAVVTAKLGHAEETVAGYAATCTEAGLSDGKKCTRCGETTVAQTVIAAKGHTPGAAATCTTAQTCTVCGAQLNAATGHAMAKIDAKDATCGDPGNNEYYYCSNCKKYFKEESGATETTVEAETITVPHTEEILPAVAPTCTATGLTEGKQCTVCGDIFVAQTVVAVLGHDIVTDAAVAATCNTTGLTEGSHCTRCDDATVEQEVVAKLGHQLKPYDYKAPTCNEAGHQAYVECTREGCGYTTYVELAATGHTEVVDAAVAPTCSATGLTEGSHCSVCNTVLVEQTEVAKLAHTEETIPGKAATCTTQGMTDGKKCSVCNETLVEQTVIAVLPHTEVIDAAVDATCTTAGKTEGKHCSACNAVLVEQEEIPAAGHKGVLVEGVDPTCTGLGSKDYYDCSGCGGWFYDKDCTNPVTNVNDLNLPPLGHDIVVDEAVAATCTATGLTEGSHCTRCDDKTVAQETVPAKGHTEETVAGYAATCTATGLTDGKKCSVCGVTTEEQTVIPMAAHTEEEIPAVEATCTATGLTAGKKCTVCGAVTVSQTVVDAKGHTKVAIAGKEATCTEPGATEGEKCSVCNAVLTASVTIPAKGHGEKETVAGYAATCTEDGLTNGEKCTVCGEMTTAQETIPALGHAEVKLSGYDATCTLTGLTDGVKCSVCGETVKAQEVIPVIPHTEVTVTGKAATCTATGLTDGKECGVCGATTVAQEVIPALGHSGTLVEGEDPTCEGAGSKDFYECETCKEWFFDEACQNPVEDDSELTIPATGHKYGTGEVTTDPTCTEEGVRTYTCTAVGCSDSYTEAIPATGHTEETVPAVDPDCENTGLTAGVKCSVCNATITAQEVVPANGHSWNDGVVTTDPTCTVDGVKTFTCSVCGDTKTETITATGHTEEAVLAVDPGCESTGLTAGVKCSVCGATITAQEEIPATGHEWVQGDYVQAPTCTEAGTANFSCSNDCGKTKVDAVDALGHDMKHNETQAPTCTEPGVSAGSYCSRCDYTEDITEIPATGHSWGEGVVKEGDEPTCTEAGVRTFTCSVCGETKTEEEPATGHSEEEIPAKAPGCTETGLTAGVKCSVCGETITEQTVVDALGHSWNDGEVTTKPTCTEDGVKTFTCGVCGGTKTETITATGHTEEIIPAVESTCSATGLTEGVKCSVCDATITAQEETAKKAHTEEIIPAVEATCTATGLTEGKKCQVCDEVLVAQEVTAKKAHTMEYTAAVAPTCTTRGNNAYYYCSECKKYYLDEEGTKLTTRTEQNISALGHQLTFVEAKDATCTADGNIAHYLCGRCGKFYEDDKGAKEITSVTLAATKHRGTISRIAPVAATCTADGNNNYFYCSACGKYFKDTAGTQETTPEAEKIPATGHKSVTDAAKAPTCTATGLTEGSHCGVCGATITAQTVVDALGHTPVTDAAVAATCTVPGKTEGSHCDVCGETLTAQEIVPATGHTEVVDAAKAPTCTETGLTEGKHCGVCGTVLAAQGTVAELGHTYVTDAAKAATCTETGLSEGKHCDVCGYVLIAQVEIAALGHTKEVIPAVAATCTAAGLTEGEKCKVCGETLTAQTVVDALGHTEEIIPAVSPSCTATGLTAGEKCSVCGEILKAQEEVAATGHTKEIIPAVSATCTRNGRTEGEKCSVCGDTLKAQEIIPATGHTPVTDEAVAPTCTATGLTSGSHCGVCGTVIVAQTEVAPKGHTPVADAAVAPTCTATGLTAGSHCGVCGETLTAQEEVAALGHTKEIIPAVAPTCTATGLSEGVKCKVCGETLTAQEEVAALGHTKEIIPAVAATCEKTGLTEGEKCSVCGEILVAQEVVAALGHTKEIIPAVAATCTTTGLTIGEKCSVCGKTLVAQNIIPAAGHTTEDIPAVEPTCTETGLTAGKKCSVCGEIRVAQQVRPATGHTNEIIPAVAATCTETGLTEGLKCTVCGETLTAQEVVPATGHTDEIIPAIAATCTETGLTEGKKCSVCGEILTAQEEIAALGHDMGEASCAAPATCKREGCGHTEGEALAHTVVEDEEVPAMCGVPGLTKGKHCSVCGKILEKQYETDALEHDIVQHEAKRATYTGVGWEAYENCTRCGYTTYVEIPMLETPVISDYETFLINLALLEDMAYAYIQQNPGKDPLNLVIKYIRTGVDRYNSGSWGIMAGYEDAGFAKFVAEMEDSVNCQVEDESQMICASSLKEIKSFTIPNGDTVDFGHMFGTMDITYHNNFGVNHADVAGWAGDLVDLLSTADRHSVTGTVEEMVDDLAANYLCHAIPGESDQFSLTDMYGDLDGYYVTEALRNTSYETGTLTEIITAYFTEDLTDEERADFMMRNRFDGISTRNALREAVYTEYTSNKVISTLEGTREFATEDLTDMRIAVCYAFADYLCQLAGDFVDVDENPYFSVFSSEYAILAPGITQEIKMATSADGKQMVYYLATADLTRDDVNVYANYNNNDPAAGWAMQRVLDQANAAQNKYGDPESEYYIENYNVITSINGAGFNMSTGEPGGLLVMGGVEYQGINANGFFGILKDGTPVIGTTEEYNTIYKGLVAEGIAGFGSTLVKDGKICITASSNYYTNRASRTAVGITKTGKVVFMVLDGRQEPWSCGGSMEEIAQIMLEAGCVHAINLDGGGSTTYVARQPGDEDLSIVSRPSDGFARSVSTTLLMVSTAPSSTAFDHAILETDADYMTVGATIQITPVGVSATGNTAELPEGTTWEISDEQWATITEDGTLTALRYGDVTVNLLLGEEIIGTKVIHIVRPDQIYFTKDNMNATYGVAADLPVKALYESKEVAIVAADVVFTVAPENAGVVEEFSFTGNEESGIKTAKITAALAHDTSISATIDVTLYKHGENSFDFDQATGGDRLLAWDRQVSNSTTDDAITYTVVDDTQPMVTSYVLAMDMTQIPIPQKLEDLIFMLPGSDAENASAWNFLLQLAERVSVLTEVKPVIQIDPNFDVDYSELTLINDYFTLNKVEFDETSNTLTLTLNWIDQTMAIDPATANPLCIVKGLKVTPKEDAEWDSKNRLTAVHTGEISYTIYLRASSLYSFCQKPENQATFGLYPFINPNDPGESGGYFHDVYISFEDTYTLVNAVKNGWINEDGGYAYYVDGQRLTGINQVDGLYYDFGESGINVGKKPYTGIAEKDGAKFYAQVGKLVSGWYAIGTDYYYFDPVTFKAHTGVSNIKGHVYTFNDEGKLILGAFVKNGDVTNYYWAGKKLVRKWIDVEGGRMYVDDDGVVAYGNWLVKENATEAALWYHFDEETGICTGLCDGFIQSQGVTYYCEQGETFYGAVTVDGGITFCGTNGKVVINSGCYVSESLDYTSGLSTGYYWCDENGLILKDGFATINGSTYYFSNYERAKGFTKIGDDYYLFNAGNGKMYADATMWVGANDYGIEKGYYYFQADGKMYVPNMEGGKAIIEENGNLYFVIDGVKQRGGLYELEGEYYYARNDATLVVDDVIWLSDFNDLIAPGNGYFGFDSNGRMIKTGFVDGGDGYTYYYKDIVRVKGFTRIGFKYYLFNAGSGKMYRDATMWVGTNDYGVAKGYYYFKPDGSMENPNSDGDKEIVEIDGKLYFLIAGEVQTCGLVEMKGEYYYAQEDGTLAVDTTMWLSNFNGLIAPGSGYFAFGSDGKMVKTGFVTGGGYTYYYDNIVRVKGFTKVGDLYYFFNAGSGKMYTDTTLWVGANSYGIAKGYYYFQPDGAMYIPGTEGKQIVEDGGKLYFVIDGVRQINGLNELDGDYYYAYPDGHLAVSTSVYISNFNGLMAPGAGQFGFDAEGKMITTGFIVGTDGYTYYYDNLVRAKGFTKIGDKYYFFNAGSGKMYANTSLWVGPNDYGVSTGYHTFQEDGSMYVPVVMGTYVIEEGGYLYFVIDGVRQTNGLNELDGEYYYANTNGILAVSTSLWLTDFNDLIAPGNGYFAFDAEGKLIKTGFITGGDGTYYYDNLVRAKGLTKIGEDYYFFNAGSGKMYCNATLWVSGSNSYGLSSGYYQFGEDGKMIAG